MHVDTSSYITLTEVAKLVPGRPTPNAIWRWCRRGVSARNGEKVRLQHVRIGGKIYTTRAWLDEFGRILADADSQYFDLQQSISCDASANESQIDEKRQREIEAAEREFDNRRSEGAR